MDYVQSLYSRWRKELFRICVLLAAIGSIAEIVIYLYDSNHSSLFLPERIYRFRFIYIPSTLNLFVIVITYFCLKSEHFSNNVKNMWACILIYFLCANTQVIHYVYGPLLMLPSVAIFVTILFSNKKLTLGIGLASLTSLLLAHHQATVELRKDDSQLNIDTILAALVMLVTYIAARLLINYVSEQITYILESNIRQKELIEECNMDPLMGISNRRALNNRLNHMMGMTFEKYMPKLVILDIDDFKKVNDTYGHISGDEVLINLAKLMKSKITDTRMEAYRYGGEEIVLLFFDTSCEQVTYDVDCLRQRFENVSYTFGIKKKVTFSAGIARMNQKDDPKEWIQRADSALYIAKMNGKNKIVVAE